MDGALEHDLCEYIRYIYDVYDRKSDGGIVEYLAVDGYDGVYYLCQGGIIKSIVSAEFIKIMEDALNA